MNKRDRRQVNCCAHITMAPGAPHLVMVADPGLVTEVILKAVHATT